MRETARHVASYYAASLVETPSYPALDADIDTDVCVVGGGFTGLSVALELAQRGVGVVLLEAQRIGWGASGRNGGQLIQGMAEVARFERYLGADAAQRLWQLGVDCVALVRERIARYGIDCELRMGVFEAATKPRHLDALQAFLDDGLRRGYPHAMAFIGRDRVREVVNSDRYLGGVLDWGSGHLNPLKLCVGEARAAAALGAKLFENTPALRVRPGARVDIHTATGRVNAAQVVLAGNAYLGKLNRYLQGRVLSAGSYIVATEPLGRLAEELLPQNTAVCDQNVALDYFRLTPDGRLLFGGLCNYSGREPRDIAASLRPGMERVFPQLRGKHIDYQWGGHLGISLNRVPQIGRRPGNVYYAQGYSGHGLGTSHMAGKILADAICGDTQIIELFEKVPHWKLPGGRWFASPALALGMNYFRFRDWF